MSLCSILGMSDKKGWHFSFHVCAWSLSHVRLFAAPWTAGDSQARGFSRQEYWSGLPWPPSEDLPNPGTEPRSPAAQAVSSPSEPPGKPPTSIVCNYVTFACAFWGGCGCVQVRVYMLVEGRVGRCDHTSRRKKLLLSERSLPANPWVALHASYLILTVTLMR